MRKLCTCFIIRASSHKNCSQMFNLVCALPQTARELILFGVMNKKVVVVQTDQKWDPFGNNSLRQELRLNTEISHCVGVGVTSADHSAEWRQRSEGNWFPFITWADTEIIRRNNPAPTWSHMDTFLWNFASLSVSSVQPCIIIYREEVREQSYTYLYE